MTQPNLAKSLHTITVYERLIEHLLAYGKTDDPAEAAAEARRVLGHDEMTDTYGLIDKAIEKAKKEAAKQAAKDLEGKA